ncbi:MAG: TolC family protein [Candidatus Omnitrophica bacterium]|nr:TolC family protein [Candidatus Omnitrophota bacterium]MBU1127586.1 TolC family protein [Candidatus Omnitrophota bacterium]MBU1783873.1 TolC family protein [Candidatus Omnitrophota bacterium]MBU1851710.1 TolC family protein [Candidatus Omnitrophota bacterium]
MTRYLVLAIILTMTIPVNTACSQSAETTSLKDLIEEAINNNPVIQKVYNEWEASGYQTEQAASLPDPIAKYTYFGESVETRVGPQENKYGIAQEIPFPAKLGMKKIAASRHAGVLKEEYEASKQEIVKKVKFVYYDMFWVDKAIQVIEGEKAILESQESVARKKYELKLAPQQDVIKAQVELSKLINKLLFLRQNRESLEAKLNNVLGRQIDTPVGQLEDVEPAEFNYELDELHRIAGESRQELVASRLNVERAEYEKSLAMMDYIPDVTLGFEYIQVGKGETTQPNDGQDAWMASVAFSVPLWVDRISSKIKEKKALLESTRKDYRSTQNDVYYEVEDTYFKINTYRDVIALYETALIPQSEQSLNASKTAYETGIVDFLNWLEAERVLLQTKLAYYRAIVDFEKSIAYLERVIGRYLEGEKNVSE